MNRGYAYVLLCYFLIGISYPIAKSAMEEIPIWIFTALTFLAAFIMLYPFVKLVDKTSLAKLSAKVWLSVSAQALLGAVLYTVFLLYGFQSASAIMASVFTSLAPAAVLTLSSVFLGERLSARKLFAIMMAIAGVLVLTLPAAETGGQSTWLGILFLLLSTLSTAGSVIAANKFNVNLPPASMAAGVCLTGFVFSIPMAVNQAMSYDWNALTVVNCIVMAYYAALVWAVPYAFFFMGVTKIPASATGMAIAVVPLAASLFAIVFYGEKMHFTDGIALLLVTISIVAAEANPSTPKPVNEPIAQGGAQPKA